MKKIFFIITCICLLNGCINNSDEKTLGKGEWRTDKQPIVKRFPYFKNSEKILWKGGRFNDDSFFSWLGPSGYWIKGYIFPEKGFQLIDNTKNDWRNVEINIENEFLLNEVNLKNASWLLNISLNRDLKKSKYSGNFYFCESKKIVYFDLFWD